MLARSFRSSKSFVTFVVCVAIFTDTLLLGLIVPILPYVLADRVGLPQQDVQRWTSILLALYGGALLLGSLFFGWLGDRVPARQTPFILGLAVLGASTLSFALGNTLPVLFIARVLQGLSSAIVFTIGSALLYDVVGKDRIGQAMGYTGMSLSLGLLLGPVVGSTLYEYGGYFQVFLPVFALIVMEIILRLLIITEKRTPFRLILPEYLEPELLPAGGSGRPCGTYGTVPGQIGGGTTHTDKSPECSSSTSHLDPETAPLLSAASSKVAGSSMAILLCSPRFLVAIVSLCMLNSITTGFDGVLPAYIHDEFDLNSMHAAFLFLMLSVPLLLSPISGTITDRCGAKWPATSGFMLLIPSLVLLRFINHEVTLPITKLAGLLFSVGLASAVAMPPLMTEVSSVVEEIEQGSPGIFGPYGAYSQAYGLVNTAFAAGSMIGPLYTGFLRERLGWPAMSLFMGTLGFIMLLFILMVTGGYGLRKR